MDTKLYSLIFGAAPHIKQYIEAPGVECSIQISNYINKTQYLVDYYESVSQDPGVKALIEERYLPILPPLEVLCEMPQDTLGYEFGTFMKNNGLSIDGLEKVVIEDDKTYFAHRARATHDFFHVALGVPPNMPGELAIQGFQAAQTKTPISKLFCSLAFLRTLEFEDSMYEYLDPLIGGYLQGRKAKLFLAQKWENMLDVPLADVRKELNVEAVSMQLSEF
ncbi:Coq4 family protein [Pseudoalteromonas tunicata]|jgi:ubiquinone biosynthesis protein Coq4|uniref:Coenzyme Q (Ubiquinone) biosynthesis protein Coq4 n=2 Tax=Pseudoalteromonas tunicata TaxID=314281 RepID=A4C848_9GAMM|nr:Coq4 family protein [Pseudoalteromonas tunicata]ABC26372.1 coenzyme Q4-like protein [Pseudoalteromonas tunicata]ATC93268.1 hypothetical protein PTUN_a0482 [Pseudoalteromonas tunicata]AXT32325.1 hypothetical protein D1819_16830 [Pseudoalteromonas tunicata]EAR28763.1 hypothetical protein PTD2_06964 [Pseudoalteromonas tunicata D2]